MDNDDTVGAVGSSADTITIDNSDFSIDLSSLTLPSYTGNVTISAGNSGSYFYSTAGSNGLSWGNNSPSAKLQVQGDAEFEGDVKVKGRSLEKMFQKIEDRLAILQDPDPAKLEKYAALKKAYDNYKTLERLIGED